MILTAFSRVIPATCVAVVLGLAAAGCGERLAEPTVETPTLGIEAPDSVEVRLTLPSTFTLTVRRNGFHGPITLSVEAPPGIQHSLAPSVLPDDVGMAQLSVWASELGIATLRIRAEAANANPATRDVRLGIRLPADSFDVLLAALPIMQAVRLHPGSESSVIAATRWFGGVDGLVRFSLAGLPPGLTASMDTSPARFTVIGLSAAADGTPGQHTLTVTAHAPGYEPRTATVDVLVQPVPSKREITFRFCPTQGPPPWPARIGFAYRNDGEGWQSIEPDSDGRFRFMATHRLAFAYTLQPVMILGGLPWPRRTMYLTADELESFDCTHRTGGARLDGSVQGASRSRVAAGYHRYGGPTGDGPFSILNVPAGPVDVVAYGDRPTSDGGSQRMYVIRRNVTPQDTLPPINFGGPEAVGMLSIAGEAGLYSHSLFTPTTVLVSDTMQAPGTYRYLPASLLAEPDYQRITLFQGQRSEVRYYFRDAPPPFTAAHLSPPALGPAPSADLPYFVADVTTPDDVSALLVTFSSSGSGCFRWTSEIWISRAYAGEPLSRRMVYHPIPAGTSCIAATVTTDAVDGPFGVFWGGRPNGDAVVRWTRGLSTYWGLAH